MNQHTRSKCGFTVPEFDHSLASLAVEDHVPANQIIERLGWVNHFALVVFSYSLSACSSLRAGFPYDVLENGHFVPGTDRWEAARYRGKDLWRAIMHVTPASSVMYCGRVNQLFTNQVTKESSAKKKDRCFHFLLNAVKKFYPPIVSRRLPKRPLGVYLQTTFQCSRQRVQLIWHSLAAESCPAEPGRAPANHGQYASVALAATKAG